jgi:indole-3-glycerol phosphate synthase
MADILETLAAGAARRVATAKERVPLAEMIARAEALPADTGFPFEAALAGPELAFICEVKKASPSKGLIAPDFPVLEIARDYAAAGAAAISCLTEPDYFLGSDDDLEAIAGAVTVPVLRKDFTVDAYQIYEAKCLGASAVLLIAALLDEKKLAAGIKIADGLGLSALVEAHDAAQIAAALAAGARIIGVNNRNLKTFEVDFDNALRLREKIPADKLYVSESGVKCAADVAKLSAIGVDAALVGETLMRADDRRAALRALKAGSHDYH